MSPFQAAYTFSHIIVAIAAQYQLEELSEADLLVNIVHHTLVPTHEVLTPADEMKLLLEKYCVVVVSSHCF